MSEQGPAAIGRAMVRGLRRGRLYLRARRELNGLDDHDLRDLRIGRADVSRIAWDEASRRIDAPTRLPRWPLASLASAARADEPASGECPARAPIKLPRWPLASLASAARVDEPVSGECPARAPIRIAAERERQFHIWLLIGSGVVAAAQVGKAIISIPLIRSEMAVGLDLAGLIVATFAALGAFFGLGAGVVVRRLGVRRALIGGMAAVALGNVIGALAPNEAVLLAARIVEGIGFFGAVLAIPSMLAQVVTRERRDFVMAVWSAYMPAGIMLMLLVGPLLPAIGWRNFWLANGAAAALCSVVLARNAPVLPAAVREPAGRFFAEVVNVVRHPRCLVLALAFFAYSCQIFSLAFALPLLLTSAHGVALGTAGLISALVLAVSTAGHVSSGFLLRAGVPIWLNIAMAFGCFALTAFVIYAGALPTSIVALAAALALGIGGLAPGAIYAAAPQAAPSPQAVPPTIGLMQQASNLGQFAGPVVLGLWAEHLGWSAAPAIVAPAALLGLAAAFALRRVLHTGEQAATTLAIPLPRGLQPVPRAISR